MLKTRNATRRCISVWRAGLGGSDPSRSHWFPNPLIRFARIQSVYFIYRGLLIYVQEARNIEP